jgi:glutamine synthetase
LFIEVPLLGHELFLIFLLFLAAVLKGVQKHQGLLRAGIATSGNEHRLGANEAPPAIISAFLGDMLTRVIEDIAKPISPAHVQQKIRQWLGDRQPQLATG